MTNRANTVLLVQNANKAVGFLGTIDDLMEFLMQCESAVYNWMIRHGVQDWIGQLPNETEMKDNGNGPDGAA